MSKQNTPGFGIEYEILVPAYFALVLNNNDDVEDFSIKSNVEKDFGNMDDVVINLKMKNGSIRKFAIQLKHKEKSKNLLATNFELGGNFSLEKYCKAFKSLRKDFRNYNFILYSNASFDSARTKEVRNFDMIQNDACLGNEFFNTSGDLQNVYKFAVNDTTPEGIDVTIQDFAEFLPKFSLYTNQKNFKKLEENILGILKFKDVYLKYVELFRKWHQGEFTNKVIDRKTLNLHLVDIFVSPFIVKNYYLSDGQNQNLELFERVVKEFDVTVIDDAFLNFKKKLLECEVNSSNDIITAKNHKFLGKSAKELDEETKFKISYYFHKKPIILDFNSSSRDRIYKTFELYNKNSGNELKFVFLGLDVDIQIFSNLKVFSKLSQIDEALLKSVTQLAQISLQGRQPITLNKIMEFCEEIIEIITPKELFFMLKNSFLIGEEKEELVSHYIPRSVTVKTIDIKVALELSIRNNDLLFIDFDGEFDSYRNMFEENSIVVSHIPDPILPFVEYSHNINVVPTKDKCTKEYFRRICRTNPNRAVHFFKVLSEKILKLIMSSNNTFGCDEEHIYTKCNNPVNIFCGQPGMGKSTLFKSLKNQCPSNIWVQNIDLKSHNSFLKVKNGFLDFSSYFMKTKNEEGIFLKKFKSLWLAKRKILFLLDGLDEIESPCVDNILDFVEDVSSMGCYVWISSRDNLQQKLENRFKTCFLEINEFSEEQQCLYVRNRLREKCRKEEIEEIVKKIFINVANNGQLLGVPLQLKIITTLFLNDVSFYENMIENDIFVLIKTYKHFFEGRYKHFLEKLGSSHFHLISQDLEDQLENYEIAALQSLFNDVIINDLNIDLRRNHRFLENIKTKKDQLGIITKIDNDNRPIFEHRTFAEYFASKFLVNNFDKARILQKYLFSLEYKNLLLIFSMMLAENNYLHLGIIYNNMDLVRKYIDDKNNEKDKGGRNVLHLIGIHILKLPKPILSSSSYTVSNVHVHYNAKQLIPGTAQELFNYLIESSKADLFERDKVFNCNVLEYCLQYGCLDFAENILRRCDHFPNINDFVWKNCDEYFIVYSIRLGYPKLLELALRRSHFTVYKICGRHLRFSPLRFIFILELSVKEEIIHVILNYYSENCNQYSTMLHVLEYLFHFATQFGDVKLMRLLLKTEVDVNFRNNYGKTALHLAVRDKQLDAVSLLLDRGAEINVKEDNFGYTPLHIAVNSCNIELVRLLVEAGADIEAEDKERRTALVFAARRGFEDGVKYLLENNAKYEANVLRDAVFGQNVQILELFLNKEIDINTKNDREETPLFDAVLKPSLSGTKMVKFLIDKGADVTVVANDGRTVFHKATIYRNVEVLNLLLEKNVEMLNVSDHNKISPLHIAVYLRNVECVELFLKKGIDLERIVTDHYLYSLQGAVVDGHLDPQLLKKFTTKVKMIPYDLLPYVF